MKLENMDPKREVAGKGSVASMQEKEVLAFSKWVCPLRHDGETQEVTRLDSIPNLSQRTKPKLIPRH